MRTQSISFIPSDEDATRIYVISPKEKEKHYFCSLLLRRTKTFGIWDD